MAMKPCKECGKEVSTRASKCPHCGVGNPTGGLDTSLSGNIRGCMQGCVLLVVAVVVLVLAAMCFSP